MKPFTERALKIIQNIPVGKVMTYGQIARCAGSPRGARQVVRILHSMGEKHQLPWHRVINSKGEIGIKDEMSFHAQKYTLESEGIEITNERLIDLRRYQHHPHMETEY